MFFSPYTIMFLIFVAFVLSRVEIIPTHFASYDDLFAPYLFAVMGQYDPVFFSSQLEKYGGSLGIALSSIANDVFTGYPSLFSFFKNMLVPIAISKNSTFAPLQFYLTAFLADLNTSYTFSKVTFRLPSAIFSLLTLYMLYNYAKKIDKNEKLYILIIASLIFTVSWMFLIYSSQGENYAAGVFSLMTLIYIFQSYKAVDVSIYGSIKVGLSISFLCLIHYQVMFFLPSFFMAMFYECNFSVKYFINKWLPSIVISGLTVLGIYYIFLRNGKIDENIGDNWNAGVNGEYAFNADCGDGFFSCASHVFYNNFFEVIQSIVSYSNIDGSLSAFYTYTILILMAAGVFYIAKSRNNRGLFVFLTIGILVWISLVLLGKLTFSPTRHSLIILPIIALLASFGFYFASSYIYKIIHPIHLLVTFCIIVLLSYGYEFNTHKNNRYDPLEIVNIEKILMEYNPEKVIAYGDTLQLEFHPIVINNYKSKYINESPYSIVYTNRDKSADGLLILCVSGVLCDNAKSEITNKILSEYFRDIAEYKNIYKYEKHSNVTEGFGDKSAGVRNIMFLSVWK